MINYLKDIIRLVERRTLLALIFTSIIVSILEAASISAVIPALNVILTDRVPDYLTNLLQAIGIDAIATQKLVILFAIVAVFLLRALTLSAILFYQSSLVFGAQTRLSNLLYSTYLRSRFESLSKVSTTEITKASTTELANLTGGVLLPMAALCSELSLVVGAMFVLLLFQPTTAITLIAMTIAFALPVLVMNRKYLSNLGAVRLQMEGNRTRFAQEITDSIREVKIYEMEPQLLSSIAATNISYAHVMTRINFLQNFPRIYFEAAGLSVLLTLCGIQLYKGYSSTDILTFMMLSGFVAFRALPSIAKIVAQLQTLRFYRPTLNSFLELLAKLTSTQDALVLGTSVDGSTLPGNPALSRAIRIVAQDASYAYSDGLPYVFKNVSFELCSGQIIGLVGQSGIGKSTLLDCIIGLRDLSEGSISAFEDEGLAAAKVQVAYVPQSPVIFEATVWRNLTLEQRDPVEMPVINTDVARALTTSGFNEVMTERELEMLSRITESGRNLSGGQRQRLALARALVRQGNLLVLDEATSALDMASEDKIYDQIRSVGRDRIVIIVTHRPQMLKYCDQVIEMLPGGKVSVTAKSTHGEISP
jgi:ATP-binding cassette, subfamily B, bacterial PglK